MTSVDGLFVLTSGRFGWPRVGIYSNGRKVIRDDSDSDSNSNSTTPTPYPTFNLQRLALSGITLPLWANNYSSSCILSHSSIPQKMPSRLCPNRTRDLGPVFDTASGAAIRPLDVNENSEPIFIVSTESDITPHSERKL